MRMLVVGGGIAGLALAQGLRRAGVDVTVCEQGRSRTAGSWLEGYQIHINERGAAALEACLGPGVRQALDANALRPTDGFQVLDEHLRELLVERSDAFAQSRPIIRSALRRVLLTDLEDSVRFQTRFTRYETLEGGQVRAHFADGSCAAADVLVGADGIGSAVRRQYLPEARVGDLGLVGMAGLVPLGEGLASRIPEALRARLTSVLASDGLYAIVTRSIHTTTTTAWPRAEADHLIWVLITTRATYGRDPRSMFDQGAALKRLAFRLTEGWHPDLRRLIEITEPAVVSATPVQSAEPIKPWATTNVTLVGDAVHAMPPLQGLGGSTALRDAALLCDRLARAAGGALEVVPAIHSYAAEMLAALRLAQALPPVRRLLFRAPSDGIQRQDRPV